jgi:hypothetical protein
MFLTDATWKLHMYLRAVLLVTGEDILFYTIAKSAEHFARRSSHIRRSCECSVITSTLRIRFCRLVI